MVKVINPKSGQAILLGKSSNSGSEESLMTVNGVYKFVDDDNYTQSFGYQWNKFEKTQIDRYQNQVSQSSERFWKETGWKKEDLKGKTILEVGSGAGRFTQIMLQETEAIVYSVDYSNATEANFRNNGPHDRLFLFQASIYELPFAPHQFDFVFCLGVLQHTPDFRASLHALVSMLKPGGCLVVDFYEKRHILTKLHAKYLVRPFTKRMDKEALLRLIERHATNMISMYKFLNKIGFGTLTRFIPICDIKNTLPANLDAIALREWVILDTFDMLSPAHDHPQSIAQVVDWLKETSLEIDFAGHIQLNSGKAAVVRGRLIKNNLYEKNN